MLRCDLRGKKSTRQFTSCNGKLFCKICSYKHFDYHAEENSPCLFGKIVVELPGEYLEKPR